MRVLTVFLVVVVVLSFVWYGYSNLNNGGDMRFVPVGQPVSDIKENMAATDFSGGGTWLNSSRLSLSELRGKVVLVDFWTYSCINCQRTLPYLRSWWEKYKDQGLVVVGVHTPEFEFEKETENVEAAMAKYGVGWPVVQDNDYKIWKAYKNQFWPHKYLVSQEGQIVYDHIGEGGYEETEREIQKLLGVADVGVTEEPNIGAVGFGMPFDFTQGKKQTPELYVNQRGKVSGHIGTGKDKVDLQGKWSVGEGYSSAGKEAKVLLNFQAGEVNLVMSIKDEKK